MEEIRHHQWRHRERGYTVTVLGVYTHGFPLRQKSVKVDRSSETSSRSRSWEISLFLDIFEPLGDPVEEMTLWDHLD
jgi:hypothetical protein